MSGWRTDNSTMLLSMDDFEIPYIMPPINQAGDLAFESFESELHLQPPTVLSRTIRSDLWHSGIPLTIQLRATNKRQQTVTNVGISVVVKLNKVEVYKQASQSGTDVNSQDTYTMTFQYTPHTPGELLIIASCYFKLEDNCCTTIHRHVAIKSPVDLKLWYPKPYLYYEVQNMLPYTITNVCAVVSDTRKPIVSLLMPTESYKGYMYVCDPDKVIGIEWSLPFCGKCRQNYSIPSNPEKSVTEFPLKVEFCDVPKLVPTLKPFEATLIIKNTEERSFSGVLNISGDELSILAHGKNTIEFHDLEAGGEKRFSVEFVALNEGEYRFPRIEIRIIGGSVFTVVPTAGVMVVGCQES